MDCFKSYNLIKEGNENILIINLNPNCTEFSKELTTSFKESILELDDQIREVVKEKFPDIKINCVKLMLGSLVVASIPFINPVETKAITTPTNTQATSTVTLNTTGTVLASRLNVRQGPSTNYSTIHVLWSGNVVRVIGKNQGWYKIRLSDGRVGWVSSAYLRLNLSRQERINKVVSTAKSLLGTPYVWGGESLSEGGFDCSGFTQYVFKQAGYNLNRISADQAKQGIYVSRQNLQPGDLVFYSFEGTSNINHVGLYIGNNQMINSPKTGDVVKITDISTSYWETRFVTARRIIL